MNFKKMTTVLAVAGAMFVAGNANATNWLKLQGTEDPGSGARAKVWGFLQPTYQKDESPGTVPEPTRIAPNLSNQEQFQLFRARVGVRGTALPLDDNVNYFVMWEMGQNAATDGGKFGQKTPTRLMDASVTLNNIPYARIRAGLFKTPGPEETFQGIPALNYINFTWVSAQMILERYAHLNTPTAAGGGYSFDSTFGAARDMGVQVFDWFRTGDWEHSYAVMIGDGNGLEPYSSENPTGSNHDLYLYWSSELVYGGKGPFQQGWKTYAWSQTGQRYFDVTDNGVVDGQNYDRTRYGIGTRYRRGDWRVGAAYMAGHGMIFQGPEKPTFSIGPFYGVNDDAHGYYVDLGYYLPSTPWEFDLRYDAYSRDTNNIQIGADFYRTTVGVQYHFNKKTRLMLNYEARSAQIENITGTPPNTNLANGLSQIGNRIGAQITVIF